MTVPLEMTGRTSDITAPAWSVSDPEVAAVLDWWSAHARPLPWRARRDVYAVWVSEVMSTQTTVNRAAEAWVRWMERWATVDALAAASLAEVLGQWQGLGYPRRARDLHRSARMVAASGWPDDLTALPGVGPYIAAAVRCFAREEPVLPVDVNVRRVLRRRFDGHVEISGDPWRAGQALMEFGQRVCTARPRCEACPVREGCAGPEANASAGPGRRQARFEGSVRQRRGRLLRRVLEEGAVRVGEREAEVAAGLASDGLAVLEAGWLRPPR
ncbi:MAG TPA: A/G-specific adenine glycosylase [Solirubrobacteraceae bacterium]